MFRAALVPMLLVATVLVSPAPVLGQGARLDAASFSLFSNGQRVGREQFSVQRIQSQEGAVLELRSESATGDRRAAMRLEVDSAGTPVRYSFEERTGAEVTLRLGGRRVRGRFATLAHSSTGEAAREYLLVPNIIALDEEGVMQYALLVRARGLEPGGGVTIPTLSPIGSRRGIVRLVLESRKDSVAIGGTRREATRWRAVTVSGDAILVWADSDGRMLRVSMASRGFEAFRDDVPR